MKKTMYLRPQMRVVELKHQCHILAGSDRSSSAGVRDYDWNEYHEE